MIQNGFIELLLEMWNEQDDSVPAGWKSRFGGSKQFFLSPDGQCFPCRRAGLEFMIKEKFEEEEVAEMRALVVRWEGWQETALLPAGWIHKPKPNSGVTTRPSFSL